VLARRQNWTREYGAWEAPRREDRAISGSFPEAPRFRYHSPGRILNGSNRQTGYTTGRVRARAIWTTRNAVSTG
jgi:hypothetical protein